MTPKSLKHRAEKLRLPIRELAHRAGVDEDNIHRIFKGQTDPRLSTMAKIDAALSQQEAELLSHLTAERAAE